MKLSESKQKFKQTIVKYVNRYTGQYIQNFYLMYLLSLLNIKAQLINSLDGSSQDT